MNLNLELERYAKLTDDALNAYLPEDGLTGVPDILISSTRYSVFAPGKRLRPCLTLAACEMLGGSVEDAMPCACAIELIHTYSLIHDDLPAMDDDDMRRGLPSNHIVFGQGQAILAGDALLSYAFEILFDELIKNNQPHYIRAASAIARCAGISGMVAGQALDLLNENNEQHDENMLRRIHGAKTGALIRACVEAGALCAKAKDDELDALTDFAKHYGLLFQITDDILDVTGDELELGKRTGKDENKLTFPAVYGIEGARERAKKAALDASAALSRFGEDARFFNELIQKTLTRRK